MNIKRFALSILLIFGGVVYIRAQTTESIAKINCLNIEQSTLKIFSDSKVLRREFDDDECILDFEAGLESFRIHAERFENEVSSKSQFEKLFDQYTLNETYPENVKRPALGEMWSDSIGYSSLTDTLLLLRVQNVNVYLFGGEFGSLVKIALVLENINLLDEPQVRQFQQKR
ncbi:MAG: hypothetical protein KIS76_01840 [Pyrinomonadaceae bacterium]|nr:hypothetical protein [Pyrinomonadaceae bacterium]